MIETAQRIHLVSLGCARNQVDSESMLAKFLNAGWALTDDAQSADAIVVNTCSFITAAADESIDTILEMARYKQNGACRRLIVTGCLPERYREEITAALPEVDAFLGTGAFDQVLAAVEGGGSQPSCVLPDPDAIVLHGSPYAPGQRHRLASGPMAYLKIAEGCDRHCTYCIIPKLRGRQKSRRVPDIGDEARHLIASGVKELVLVAQDTTHYGRDLEPATNLARLAGELAAFDAGVWIRILYGHPESISDDIIATMAETANICAYLDIPIQHAAGGVLKRMGRHYGAAELERLFDSLRAVIPSVALRTTVITGFPGETDNDFEQLLAFIQRVRFDHLGVFTYSDADDLPSHGLPNPVDEQTAQERYKQLMACQAVISEEINTTRVGRRYPVLVEEELEPGLFAGRTMFQAPEVDGVTYVRAPDARPAPGDCLPVSITDALVYDLIGDLTGDTT